MRPWEWGPEGPPDEAYSRVTEPEYFAPLHDAADALLDHLAAAFDVQSATGDAMDPLLEGGGTARPTRRLVPRDPAAAPVTFAFTSFPGIAVRFGRWHVDGFPSCGCDACDETVDGEVWRLETMIDALTTGGFREGLRLPRFGDGWSHYRFTSPSGSRGGKGRVPRARAMELLGGGEPGSIEWGPWPRR